ncbi:MAG: bifunctional riboflavin kinase/FAD synthetase [Fimbriimonadaceae bacterium]|nr:bifunctional riboflavin kinase/FAD synthetase [Fimbriimonadaceae bacterium]
MQIHFGEELLRAEWSAAVVCLGTFDGVHLGHQTVISTAVRAAKSKGLPCVLLTFDRHPAAILAPERCPKQIASLASNLEAFAKLGVAAAVVLPFTLERSQTPAEAFFEEVIVRRVRGTEIVVGHDFAFGKNRLGTPDWLKTRIETDEIPPFEIDELRVSSSGIRRAVMEGDVEQAGRWLGRAFDIEGIVVSGQRLGRTLGFPTINLARSVDGVLPKDGIYAGLARIGTNRYAAAISIGFRPTVQGKNRTLEAYLIDYPGREIYGEPVTLEFHRRVRDEAKFESLSELKTQMARDVEFTSNIVRLA